MQREAHWSIYISNNEDYREGGINRFARRINSEWKRRSAEGERIRQNTHRHTEIYRKGASSSKRRKLLVMMKAQNYIKNRIKQGERESGRD